MKVYLSGAISKYLQAGLVDIMENNFEEQKQKVLDYYEKIGIPSGDIEIFNPAELQKVFCNRDEAFYLSICLKELILSEVVFFQNNWNESLGCGSEYFIATRHNKQVKIMEGL